eukprot:Phypoly_transcript_04313.p1 GENE.Phypoly_transcript_04313~~Phypoly_transcript_04313.p1  ORF type:complete len:710 (+),score=100.16 Phypoly_transcript_04313:49-2178(+)
MRVSSLLPCVFIFSAVIGLCFAFSPEKHRNLGWQKLSTPTNRTHEIKFSVFLKQQNLHVLEKTFWDVSDPKSKSYGNYLSMEEITHIVSPSEQTITKVTNWLAGHDISKITFVENKDVAIITADINTVEQLLTVPLAHFQHTSGKKIIRSDTMYSIPAHLTEHIDFIHGISNFPIVSPNTEIRKPRVSREAASGTPKIIDITGHNKHFIITIEPQCLTSSFTGTAPPCKDYPPALTSVTVTLNSPSKAADSISVTVEPSCVSDGFFDVFCTVTVTVPNYNLYNLSLQANFEGGNKSGLAVQQYPIMTSPELTPAAIKSYYKIPPNQKVNSKNVTQSVAAFERQYYNEADLSLFFKEMGLPKNTPTVIGPNDQSRIGIEANLDMQYIMGIAVGAPTTFWSIDANSSTPVDDILAWAVAVANSPNPPLVNSLSYGMVETAIDQYLGRGYLNRSDVEFQKLALRGITIIFADGDTGAASLGPPPQLQESCKPFVVTWPSQSPYVTSVGATMLTPLAQPICYLPVEQGGVDCTSLPLGEVAATVELGTYWTTGGGFANTSSRPSYQEDFVANYLTTLTDYGALPPSEYFNSKGRVLPDVAMVGHNLLIAQRQKFMTIDGTSASAPVFAGFVSLLNDIRHSAKRPPLGFLNPILYQIARDHPGAYNDVVVGNNRCGTNEDECCPYGFQAVPGFDAVSGLGSPNFEIFSKVILNY